VVRVNSTLNVADRFGSTVRTDGTTLTVSPGGACTLTKYTLAWRVVFVTVRVTVCLPARSPMAIDG
jgi:hypothetical protein